MDPVAQVPNGVTFKHETCWRCGVDFHTLDITLIEPARVGRRHYVRCPVSIEGGSEHYKSGKIEPLELIEAQSMTFHMGNVIKYAVRADFYRTRDKVQMAEAVDKAIWYLNRFREINK